MSAPVLVLGAGLSGLACAHDLARAGREVLVLEAGPRAGGVVGTEEREGYRFEIGPHTLQASSEHFRRLCGDVGLAPRLVASRPEARERYLWHKGALHALPSSLGTMVSTPLLSLAGKLRIAGEALRRFRPPADGREPDMESFLAERLGPEAALRLGGAFVRGVYAAELRELGAASAFPRMYRAALERGSLVRGLVFQRKPRAEPLPGPQASSFDLLSFPGGLQELVDALARALGERLQLGERATALERTPGGWNVRTTARTIAASELVLALPAPAARELLAGLKEVDSRWLADVGHAHVVLVHAGYAREDVPRLRPGFGFLVPPRAAEPASEAGRPAPVALGMIFASNLFAGRAPEGCVAIAGFYRGQELEPLDETRRIEQAGRDLALALGLDAAPRPRIGATRTWKNVIPRYAPGHRARVRELQRSLSGRAPGLHLAGGWVDGVSVELVIARGRAVAQAILAGRPAELPA